MSHGHIDDLAHQNAHVEFLIRQDKLAQESFELEQARLDPELTDLLAPYDDISKS